MTITQSETRENFVWKRSKTFKKNIHRNRGKNSLNKNSRKRDYKAFINKFNLIEKSRVRPDTTV